MADHAPRRPIRAALTLYFGPINKSVRDCSNFLFVPLLRRDFLTNPAVLLCSSG